MLKIKQYQMKVILDKQDANDLILDLSEKYKLLIHEMKKRYLDKLGVNIQDKDEWIIEKLIYPDARLLGGDIISLPPDSIIYYKIPFEKDLIEVGILGDTTRKEFDQFADEVKDIIQDALEDDQKWEPARKLNASFNILADNAHTIKPKEEEIQASVRLQDATALSLMKIIKEKDSIFMDKLMEEAKVSNLEDFVKAFADLGLINSDFALLCNKTGQQILRIPTRSALDEISQKGFKCFICGASISDEKLVRAISCSDFGKKMLEDDYWFLVLALNALNTIGIPFEKILIYNSESPDTNIFLNLNDEAVMFQLVNRKLSLDDAYLINAHIAAYQLNYLIIASTLPVSAIMKSHLKETNPNCSIHFIEGLDDLAKKVNEIFVNKEKDRVEDTLKDLGDLTPIPVEELIMKKILPKGKIKLKTGLEDMLLTDIHEEQASMEIAIESEIPEKSDMMGTSIPGDLDSEPSADEDYFEDEVEEAIMEDLEIEAKLDED